MIKTNRTERKPNGESPINEIGEKRSLIVNRMERKIEWIGHLIRHDDFPDNVFEGKNNGTKTQS